MNNESTRPAPFRYDAAMAAEIEARWQDHWEREGTFEAPNPVGDLAGESRPPREKFFIMDMFPYPSGTGLHVGHPLGYIATDVVGRHRRMLGENVLHTLGYDAFGLPAEQYAVLTGQHPRTTTEQNIVTMRRQLRRLGLAHDHRRSIATTDPEFVRWTQWIFLQIFNAWYDPSVNDGAGAARPIDELIKEFADGTRTTPGGKIWTELPVRKQNLILDDFRLAYLSETPVNWCPGLGTVLANEEVTADGRSERGNFPVFSRNLRQWKMRITAFADRLIDDLERVDWPLPVKSMQRNWIGRSVGATVHFSVSDPADTIEVFTTRPDTLFGATYLVLAPEHPLLTSDVPDAWPDDLDPRWSGGAASPREAIAAYQASMNAKITSKHQENKDKTGVFAGTYAINPVDGRRLPIFVSDYVLMDYGTGAIMAVPGQDQRDWDFAEQFGLPMIRTVQPPADFTGAAFTGTGSVINSEADGISLDGLEIGDAKELMMEWLEDRGAGRRRTTYRLRDWLFSRQRYWGEPFPIVYGADDQPIALPVSMLPVELPDLDDFSPRTFDADDAASMPEPPLARNADWVNVELDLGDGPWHYRRETNTMPNWAASSWYAIRYTDPHCTDAPAAAENERYWLGPREAGGTGGVDLYVGGVEHAVLHLLYARFWHKVLFDLGHVSSEEPFQRLFNQGYIQAAAFTDDRGVYVSATDVEEGIDDLGRRNFSYQGKPVDRSYGKMGKSLKNSVNPDDLYAAYGADTFRVYEMSMGPLDESRPWETRAVVGGQRFLQRLWRLVIDEETGETICSEDPLDRQTLIMLNRTIAGVTDDMDRLQINTVIAKLIVYTSFLTKQGITARAAIEPLILMLAPIAPHLSEESWSRLGHDTTLAYALYPVADPRYLVADTVTCVVQVNGKVRARLDVPAEISDSDLESQALEDPNVRRFIADRPVRKSIGRAPRLINFVI